MRTFIEARKMQLQNKLDVQVFFFPVLDNTMTVTSRISQHRFLSLVKTALPLNHNSLAGVTKTTSAKYLLTLSCKRIKIFVTCKYMPGAEESIWA
jgi:hypothetical protein